MPTNNDSERLFKTLTLARRHVGQARDSPWLIWVLAPHAICPEDDVKQAKGFRSASRRSGHLICPARYHAGQLPQHLALMPTYPVR
jgi:hypothetical protein